MKIKTSLWILAVFLFNAANLYSQTGEWYTEGNFEPKKRVKVTITNTLDNERKNCPVVIERGQFPVQNIPEREFSVVDPSLASNPEPTAEQLRKMSGYLLRKETGGHYIEYQLDDIDKDGVWDELFFMTDLKPRETKTIYVYLGVSERGLYPHKTHAGMGYYGRHMVPFWESEFIGWKLWYPTDVDLHGKREPMLVANIEYSKNLSGYYMPWEYGTDMMTVATTFGSGGIGLFEYPSQPDSLSRPRFSPMSGKGPFLDTRYSFDVVVNGPLRSMIKVKTMNWNTGNGQYEIEQLYTAYAFKSYSTCKVTYPVFHPSEPMTAFACGIRKIMNEEDSFHQGGLVISNGKKVVLRIPDEDIGDDGLTVNFEAIAIAVKESYKPEYRDIKGFGGNYAFKIAPNSDRSFEYMITAGWSEGSVNKTKEEFQSYMLSEYKKYNNPAGIKIGGVEEKK